MLPTRRLERLAWALPLIAALVLAGLPANAACGGKTVVTGLTPIPFFIFSIPPSASATFETFELSAGSDTVIHVQNAADVNGGFISGNDDCNGVELRSCVSLAPSPTTRLVSIVVRGFADGSGGQARLRANITGQALFESTSFTFGGKRVPGPDVQGQFVTMKAYTTAIQKQAVDTVLLELGPIVDDDIPQALAWDDDDGVDAMSSLTATGNVAGLIVGTYPGSVVGSATVVWDEDSIDSDHDGLGDCLEAALGTSSSTLDADGDGIADGFDTDKDGINDGLEIKGQETVYPSQIFPTWGADPTVQDVFIEADWNECAGCSDPDVGRLDGPYVETFASFGRWPPNDPSQHIVLHVDIGVDNPAPAGDPSLTRWGNWGGATRRPDNENCDSLTPQRVGTWHLMLSTGGQRWGFQPGTCFAATTALSAVHELAHNFRWGHEPLFGAGYQATYESPMNYAYAEAVPLTTYSINKYGGVVLNPYAGINEQNWLGTSAADPTPLHNYPFFYAGTGRSVDWNYDGQIAGASTTVQAPVNMLGERGYFRSNSWPSEGVTDPMLVWYRSSAGPRLYMFERRALPDANQNRLSLRYSRDAESGCNFKGVPFTSSPCSSWSPLEDVTNATTSGMAVGATEFTQSGTRKLMLVYANMTGELQYQVMTVDGAGLDQWTSPVRIDAAGVVVSGPPQAFNISSTGRVEVYATSSGVLKRWSYNISSNRWDVLGATQTWTTGGNIAPSIPVAMALGYLRGSNNQRLLGVIETTGFADLAVRSSSTSNAWSVVAPAFKAFFSRPSLAYRPWTNSDPTSGRFFIVTDGGGDNHPPRIMTSYGDDPSCTATSRSVCKWSSGFLGNEFYQAVPGTVVAEYNPSQDTNLRAAHVNPSFGLAFLPIADSLVNADFRDQVDYSLFKKNIACGFDSNRCFTCTGLATDGTCAAWIHQ